jgi:hypothetical protein
MDTDPKAYLVPAMLIALVAVKPTVLERVMFPDTDMELEACTAKEPRLIVSAETDTELVAAKATAPFVVLLPLTAAVLEATKETAASVMP